MPKRLNITLDDTLYDKIKELSTKELRSVSNMIEFILNTYVSNPGMYSTPTQPILHYPPGVRSPIPEQPYKITSETKNTQSDTKLIRRKSIIGDDPLPEHLQHITNTTNTTSTTTKDGHKKHPLVWLRENNIDPEDISENTYNKLHAAYPDVEITDFVNYQHDRQNAYKPDPNDPYDPTINNPYLRNK